MLVLSWILCIPGNDPSPSNTVFLSSLSSKEGISLMRFSDNPEDNPSIGGAWVDIM